MSQIATTTKQSQRLLEAGVSPSSADMCLRLLDREYFDDPYISQDDYVLYIVYGDDLPSFTPTLRIPAWSLSALWDLVHQTDKTYEFPSSLSSEQLIENLVTRICYRREHQ